MSHSFKKNFVYKDRGNRSKIKRYWKRQENKKVRRLKATLRKSNEYRKIGESWRICDYRFYETKPDGAAGEELNHWEKFYFRK